MAGARIFVAIAFVVLGASFVASTALLMYEFRSLDWLTMVVARGHLFLFFPAFGVLALIAFGLLVLWRLPAWLVVLITAAGDFGSTKQTRSPFRQPASRSTAAS